MELGFLLQGLLIGFSIAAPVGPIGVLCIQRTIHYGRASGFVTGLGAATADGLYGAVAAFGLTGIASLVSGGDFWLRLVGGVFLAYLGVRTLLRLVVADSGTPNHSGLFSDYATTIVLTLLNPATILSFAAVFASLGLARMDGDVSAALTMVAGVFIGSAAWWLMLSYGIAAFRARFNPAALRATNIVSGLILLGFAGLAFVGLM